MYIKHSNLSDEPSQIINGQPGLIPTPSYLKNLQLQVCTVEIESFGYTMSDLKYAWNSGDNSVQMSPEVSLPQFNILGHRQRLIEVEISGDNRIRI